MMLQPLNNLHRRIFIFLASSICFFILAGPVFADVTINILAVNGTDKDREKNINYHLPQEITEEDVLDSAGLKLSYDVEKGAYAVIGRISLGPKETKTLKVRIRDIWVIDQGKINDIKTQIDESLKRIQSTEFAEVGVIRKEFLTKRLDYIFEQQERYADNVEKRIDSFRIYSDELNSIRNDAVSIEYWRTKPPDYDESNVVTFIIEAENPSKDHSRKYEHKHYLPSEVKPEHFVEIGDFDFKYDAERGQTYLVKEEEFEPAESKKYQISIVDVWKIDEQEIENLRYRTRNVYRLLEKTVYVDTAKYLVASIKRYLEEIEFSQSLDKNINEHISTFSKNEELFELAEGDVESLEQLLRAVREDLERSKLKNVLEKVKSVQSIVELARTVFKKPEINTAWKIIMGIVTFVALYTIFHFAVWKRRSKDMKNENEEEEFEE